jgi:hypothetical protein
MYPRYDDGVGSFRVVGPLTYLYWAGRCYLVGLLAGRDYYQQLELPGFD